MYRQNEQSIDVARIEKMPINKFGLTGKVTQSAIIRIIIIIIGAN